MFIADMHFVDSRNSDRRISAKCILTDESRVTLSSVSYSMTRQDQTRLLSFKSAMRTP